MMNASEIRAYNTLRAIALSTSDPLARSIALGVLGESAAQAREALSLTCLGDDLESLRAALERQY